MTTDLQTVETVDAMPVVAQAKASEVTSGQLMQMCERALEKGIDPQKIYDLVVQMNDREARAEFSRQMAAFQNVCPFVSKNASADFESKKVSGGRVKYSWASLDHIVETLRPILPQYGFSYYWDFEIAGPMVKVICVVEHLNGVKRTSSMTLPTESSTPAMSPQQRYAASVKFGKRITLASVLGLTEKIDDEGADETLPPPEMISLDQQNAINDLLISVDDAKLWKPGGQKKFFEIYTGSEDGKLCDIPAAQFETAASSLRTKLERGKVK